MPIEDNEGGTGVRENRDDTGIRNLHKVGLNVSEDNIGIIKVLIDNANGKVWIRSVNFLF